MATLLHIDTDSVRNVAQLMMQSTDEFDQIIQGLNTNILNVDWSSPSRVEFEELFGDLSRRIKLHTEENRVLGQRLSREVDEWENTAATLDNSFGSKVPFSGGFFTDPPFSQINSFFTTVTAAPWLITLPTWLQYLYEKFFSVPTSNHLPNVVVENSKTPVRNEDSPLGNPVDNKSVEASTSAQQQIEVPPVIQASPSAKPIAKASYDSYFDIVPKGQGTAFGNAACLPTSIGMITDYYHKQNESNIAVGKDDLLIMLDKGDGTRGLGVGFDKLNDDLNELGYKDVRVLQSDLDGLKVELNNGPLVVNVKAKLISSPERTLLEGNSYDHAVLVKGISNENVLVNDPWSGKELEIPVDQFERMWSNGGHWTQIVRPE